MEVLSWPVLVGILMVVGNGAIWAWWAWKMLKPLSCEECGAKLTRPLPNTISHCPNCQATFWYI